MATAVPTTNARRGRLAAASTLAVVLALAACGPTEGGDPGAGGDAQGSVQVLAWDEGWRDGLQEELGFRYLVMEITADEAEAAQAWEDNVDDSLESREGAPDQPGIYGDPAAIDHETQALVVVSSGASSTCRVWVDDVRTTDGVVEVDLGREPADACTDDLAPYRVVLAVDRDRLPAPEELPVTAVDLPSENLRDVDGEVVDYPAG